MEHERSVDNACRAAAGLPRAAACGGRRARPEGGGTASSASAKVPRGRLAPATLQDAHHEDSDRIRTPVPIESVQRFRGFRTPGGVAVR
jgi:hypothetical protein